AACGLRQSLALEAKRSSARGVFRDRQFHRAAERRHAYLAAEHRFIERDRQFDAQIAAVDLKEGMRRDADRDQEIAGPVAVRGLALPLQPDLLAGGDAGGNLDIELLAGRQPDALLDALDRLFQRHRHGDGKIEIERNPAGIEFEGVAAAGPLPPARGAAEHAVEDVLETAAANAAGAEGVGLEAAGAGATARVAAGKALKARLALGVDLAAIERLALVLVAQDLVGRVQLGKARLGFRIVLVGVGVMLLGELAIGALDRRSAGAPRHPQDLIGVAHPSRLLQGKSDVKLRAARPLRFHLGFTWHFCNGVSRFSPATTASKCEFPSHPGWSGRRRPAASSRSYR